MLKNDGYQTCWQERFGYALAYDGLEILVVVLCFLIVAINGSDRASIGFVAPAIRAELNLMTAS